MGLNGWKEVGGDVNAEGWCIGCGTGAGAVAVECGIGVDVVVLAGMNCCAGCGDAYVPYVDGNDAGW